jgi:hypothetical protein
MPRFSIAKTSKICPTWDFWFENKPSGNPASHKFTEYITACFKKSADLENVNVVSEDDVVWWYLLCIPQRRLELWVVRSNPARV